MKKIFITLTLIVGLLLGGCTSNAEPTLEGTYQSELQGINYVIQMIFQPEDNSFVEYINNREVDKGTYEKINNVYKIKSELQDFEITLDSNNSFDIIIDKINDGKPIKLDNIDDTPIYNSTKFDDIEKYKELLNKN
ncbi:hypothetical protein [Paucisalibacillus globulus]|uniref:hypothetical protein n=1 Tax=Paucisalibacillus globulus TaxID=351095 RepID=UPI000BB718D5|nr:hypothetical protein [Paucisalibacillus globulus]